MPLQLPNLDDRPFDDLLQEAISLIPAYAPEWTNYNPTDPGITLIELFAYLSELLIYRLNRVTNANRQAFLNLIVGLDDQGKRRYNTPLDEATLNQEIRKAVLQLRQCDRAITREDFERHAIAASPQVARAHCIPRRNLSSGDMRGNGTPGHISVVIVPTASPNQLVLDQRDFQPSSELIQVVSDDLEPRRLLTTRVHVVAPRYVAIGVRLEIHLKPDTLEADVRPKVQDTLKRFFHPLLGGANGNGWEFGRSVFVSEIYQLLDQLPGVDYVTTDNNQPELNLSDLQDPVVADGDRAVSLQTDRYLTNQQNQRIGIRLFENELINLAQMELQFVSSIR